MKRKIMPIAVTSLLLGILFDIFLFGKEPGIGVFLYTACIVLATVYLATLFKSHLSNSVYTLMPAVLFFAAMIFVRASEMLIFFNIVLVMYLLLLIARLAVQPAKSLLDYRIIHYFDRLPQLPFRFLGEAKNEFMGALAHHDSTTSKARYIPIIRGILISLPFLFIFLMLLTSADLEFQRFVSSLFNFHINGEVIFRWLLVLFVTSLFVGTYAAIYMRPVITEDQTEAATKFNLGSTEAFIVLGSIAGLFLLFLIFQLTYFFGGENRVLTTNFTYAEYARRGFFELIAVAAISTVLIWGVKQSTRLQTVKQNLTLKWLAGGLIAEVMIIMLSAHKRLSLYEATYGYTQLRLLSHLAIYWLGIALVLLLVYIIRNEREQQFAFRLFISVLAFFAVLNIINPDALIARQNIDRFNRTSKVDAYYLTSLSADAVPMLTQLLDSKNPAVVKTVSSQLALKKNRLQCTNKHWQSFNISNSHAKNILQEKSSDLETRKSGIIPCQS